MNRGLAATKINEAFQLIQDEHVWSFQLQTGGWLTPGILGGQTTAFLSPGTITVQPFSNTVTGDLTASAAWAAASNPLITSYQIRVPYYSIYSITSFTAGANLPYSFVIQGTSPAHNYSFAVYSGSFDYTDIGTSGTPIPNPIFRDIYNGLFYQLSVVSGSFTLTQVSSPSSSILSYSVADTETSSSYAFQVASAALEVTPTGLSNFATLTLDRPWMEPAQVNAGYMAYQAYFPAPAGLKKWLAIRDTTNNQPMDWWTYTQVDLSEIDPQRTDFAEPQYVVPYGPDNRIGSATFGQFLYELWQGPLTQLPYTYQCEVNWPALVNPNDTLPYPLTEELVKFRTYEVISLWKEMQKGDEMERGSGANWQFLAKAYREEYESRLKKISLVDRQLCELYFTRMKRYPGNVDSFVSVTGQMSVGM